MAKNIKIQQYLSKQELVTAIAVTVVVVVANKQILSRLFICESVSVCVCVNVYEHGPKNSQHFDIRSSIRCQTGSPLATAFCLVMVWQGITHFVTTYAWCIVYGIRI